MKKFFTIFAVLIVCFTTSVGFAAAAENYDYNGVSKPPVTNEMKAEFEYFYLVPSGLMYATTEPLYVEMNADGSASFQALQDGLKAMYTVEGDTWKKQGSTQAIQVGFTANYRVFQVNESSNLQWSSHDIAYKESGDMYAQGDPNFLPMAEAIRVQAGKVLKAKTLPAIAKVMMVIVSCGVGLIALLSALKVLPRVLHRFL